MKERMAAEAEPLWKHRSFAAVWAGNGISELGGAFGTFCLSILVYQLTGSALALGSMWLLYYLPSLVLQLFIGPYIDRWSRKWIMILAQWTRGAVFLIPLVSIITGDLDIWHLYAVQCAIGLLTPLYVPASHAITPTLVSGKRLQTANAYLESTARLMAFMSPLLAGLVIEWTSTFITLSLVVGIFIVSGSLLLLVEEPRATRVVRKAWMTDFKEGVSYFFLRKQVVWLGIFLAVVQFGVGVTLVTTLPYVTGELGGSYAHYGYFLAGFPIGYMLGAILVTKISYANRRLIMLGSLFIGGLTFLALFAIQNLALAITTEVIGGVVMAVFSIQNTTLCQRNVQNSMMGKVFSIRLLIIRGVMPLGIVVGGFLSEIYGIRPLYLLIGSLICTASALGMLLPYFTFLNEETTDERASA